MIVGSGSGSGAAGLTIAGRVVRAIGPLCSRSTSTSASGSTERNHHWGMGNKNTPPWNATDKATKSPKPRPADSPLDGETFIGVDDLANGLTDIILLEVLSD